MVARTKQPVSMRQTPGIDAKFEAAVATARANSQPLPGPYEGSDPVGNFMGLNSRTAEIVNVAYRKAGLSVLFQSVDYGRFKNNETFLELKEDDLRSVDRILAAANDPAARSLQVLAARAVKELDRWKPYIAEQRQKAARGLDVCYG